MSPLGRRALDFIRGAAFGAGACCGQAGQGIDAMRTRREVEQRELLEEPATAMAVKLVTAPEQGPEQCSRSEAYRIGSLGRVAQEQERTQQGAAPGDNEQHRAVHPEP